MKPEMKKELGDCMMNVLFAVSQLHYIHWLTEKNHHHAIVGECYSELESELDELVEQYLGAVGGNPSDLLPPPMAMQYTAVTKEKEIIAYLDTIVMRLEKGLGIVENDPKLKFMQDTLSDMLAIVHSTKYQIKQQ